MSEGLTKSSVKKGFTAPVLKKSEDGSELKENVNETKKKKVTSKENKPAANQEARTSPEKSKKQNHKEKNNSGGLLRKNEAESLAKKKPKKPEVSLSDSQYDDIFSAVLTGQGSNQSQLNTPIDEIVEASEKLKENSPSIGVKEVYQTPKKRPVPPPTEYPHPPKTPMKTPKRPETKTPPSSHKVLSELSPWGSHFNKQPSQGSSILKEMQESQNSLLLDDLLSTESSNESDSEHKEEVAELSQKSFRQLSQGSCHNSQIVARKEREEITTDQRKKLEHLQELRNVGVWVYCCRQSCQKQRYLADVTDPQDVPDIWYCHMNPDPRYNNCQYDEQQLSPEEEEDMIYNQYTAGSLVWARVFGYPWWPAMVDDDPDLEQYYWLEVDMKTVTYYHVVFFDESTVTRAWVTLANISPYIKHENSFKSRVSRGLDFSRRIAVAREQADDATTLTTAQRLKVYSFISRYKGPITTSANKVKQTMTKYKLKVKVPNKTQKRSAGTEEERKPVAKRGKKKLSETVKSRDLVPDHKKKEDNNDQKQLEKKLNSSSGNTGKRKKLSKKFSVESFVKQKKETNCETDVSDEEVEPKKKKKLKTAFEKSVEKIMKKKPNNVKKKTVEDNTDSVSQIADNKFTTIPEEKSLSQKMNKEAVSHEHKQSVETENSLVIPSSEVSIIESPKINSDKAKEGSQNSKDQFNDDIKENGKEDFKEDTNEKVSEETFMPVIEDVTDEDTKCESNLEKSNKISHATNLDADQKSEKSSNSQSNKPMSRTGSYTNIEKSKEFSYCARNVDADVSKGTSNSQNIKPTDSAENFVEGKKQPESETPSGIGKSLSQKSQPSDRARRCVAGTSFQNTEDTIGSVIQASQESKHSQSTIADFFALESEDAVVPEAELSQLSSQPFEE